MRAERAVAPVRRRALRRWCVAFALACAFAAAAIVCSGVQPGYNVAAAPATPPAAAAVPAAAGGDRDDRDTLVLVALSGGGTRAAAVGWRVLEQLQSVPYRYRDRSGAIVDSTLAEQIDLISGISGGSFAAAAWALHRDRRDVFRRRFVERDVQGALTRALFAPPWRLLALTSPTYDRIHVAAEFYDREVFDGKTFGDLPARPLLRIHATDLDLGTRFEFTAENFRLLGSDVSRYPLGYACAASSAFPVLLSPLTLRNHPPALDLADDLRYVLAARNARRDVEQHHYTRMREHYNDKRNAYVHLADGGLVDNQGLQALLDEFATGGLVNARINGSDGTLRRIVVLNVNAGVAQAPLAGRTASAPGIASVLLATTTASMDVLSAKRWMELKRRLDDVRRASIDLRGTSSPIGRIEAVYAIEVGFRNIRDAELRRRADRLPTSFRLDAEQLALIDAVVPDLLREDPDWVALTAALQQEATALQ